MSNEIDALLDAELNDGEIILTVDEKKQSLNYDGGELILGVAGDKNVKRVYFQIPKTIKMDGVDVGTLADNVEIYVNYENANKVQNSFKCVKKKEYSGTYVCDGTGRQYTNIYFNQELNTQEIIDIINTYCDTNNSNGGYFLRYNTLKTTNGIDSLAWPGLLAFRLSRNKNTNYYCISIEFDYIGDEGTTLIMSSNIWSFNGAYDNLNDNHWEDIESIVNSMNEKILTDFPSESQNAYIAFADLTNRANLPNQVGIQLFNTGGTHNIIGYSMDTTDELKTIMSKLVSCDSIQYSVDDVLTSYWSLSDDVTVKDGTVNFNLCIKYNTTPYEPAALITNEWHTTSYKGTILSPTIPDSIFNKTMITVDEPFRSLVYEGRTLLLGVEGDYQAERIYFRSPRYVHDDIDLMADSTTIYVNYKNAVNEPYIQECTDKELVDSNTVLFSWLLSSYVTQAAGKVKFNVCVKSVVGTELVGEWHTTDFVGNVLTAVDVSDKTPEVLTEDTVTTEKLIEEIKLHKEYTNNALTQYQNTADEINNKLNDIDAHVEESVDTMFTNGKTISSDNIKYPANPDGTLTDTLNNLINRKHQVTTTIYTKPSDVGALSVPSTSNTTSSRTVNLNSAPVAGSKLVLYFNNEVEGHSDYAGMTSFSIELNVMANSKTSYGIAGQGSIFICNTAWTGFVTASLHNDVGFSGAANYLYLTLYTIKYGDVSNETARSYFLTQVDMIETK